MSRVRGKIVLVGVTGLELKREDFYEKELTFQVSCSYGPGRYDPAFEEKGQDYPFGFVRWTEGRNFQAILELMRDGKLDLEPLITKSLPFGEAPSAYDLLLKDSAHLGIVLKYPQEEEHRKTVPLKGNVQIKVDPGKPEKPVIGMIGAGNFASRVLIPAFKSQDAILHTLVSAGGLSAAVSGGKFGFGKASTDIEEIFNEEMINTVVIASRHDQHADLVIRSLEAGKHVFVEKPLALTVEQLSAVKNARENHPGTRLMVGYNRRFSPLATQMSKLLDSRTQPLSIIYTVNPGFIPSDHWTQDPDVGGGRIIGEACHMIDFLRFLVGAPILTVSAQMMGGSAPAAQREDKMTITLGFEDGSLGTVHYFANGSIRFPKERVEVFNQGQILQLDNFRVLKGYQWPGFSTKRLARQDKGHQAEIKAFLDVIQSGSPDLIPWQELEEVTRASFSALENDRGAGSDPKKK
ncbi:MAG: Gfo/Idh/MocA family oxidoreductase [Deltaproteobacteria bacterium]|nr:Gfo/Idh/MocA family oxidoreductase [Deltaproteobacteria bacterium]